MTDARVAVIGYGLAGRAFHAPFVAATDGLTLSAVVTGNPERAAEVGSRYPDAAVIATMDDLWRRVEEFDLIVVASPNRFHVEQTATALRAGRSVVVDKPVAATSAELAELILLADQAGTMLTVFQNRRWDGDFRTVAGLLADGRLGGTHRFESRFERSSTGPRVSWKGSADPADLAGILYDLGSHVIDQAITLFGRPDSVYAEITGIQDATVLLTHGPVHSYLRMSSVTTPAAPRFTVTGAAAGYHCWGLDPQEKASVAGVTPTDPGFGAYPREQWGSLRTGAEVVEVPTLDGDYLGFWRGVESCLRGESGPPVPTSDTLALTETIDAALVSAQRGTPVRLI